MTGLVLAHDRIAVVTLVLMVVVVAIAWVAVTEGSISTTLYTGALLLDFVAAVSVFSWRYQRLVAGARDRA